MSEMLQLTAENQTPERLDSWLADSLEEVSRSKVKAWCKEGLVQVNGEVRKGSYMVSEGADVQVAVPEERTLDEIIPENIPLDIIFEDDHIIVVNKTPGMVVHPGAGVWSGTLVHALAWRFKDLSTRGGILRPGIVHRLDKGTSGIILVAKTDAAHHALTDQWQTGSVTKVYKALAWGAPDPEDGEIETHIGRHARYRQLMAAEVEGGRYAHSRYKTVQRWDEASEINVHILTGRTHQIRVHLAHIGHPVVGDAMYGKNRHKNLARSFEEMPDRPMLHAALLRFNHPHDGKTMTFKQPPPSDYLQIADALSRWPY